MKKTLIAFIIVCIAAACSTEKKQINDAARHYLQATADYDVSTAINYCTPETGNALRTIERTLLSIADSNYIKENTPAEITLKKTILTTDTTAKVAYHKKTPIQQFSDTLNLVKRDGRWMAQINIAIPVSIPTEGENVTKNSDGSVTTHIHYDSVPTLTRMPADSLKAHPAPHTQRK